MGVFLRYLTVVCSVLLVAKFSDGISMNFDNFRPFDSFRYPFNNKYPFGLSNMYNHRGIPPQGCPICDSSVFSYCDHKLVHDACCCGDPYYTGNSYECQFADCGYLYANNCRESDLIASCCCEDGFRSMNKNILPYRIFGKK